ncbi:MAG: hypothetical protein ACYDCI_05640 [Candidatus Limnocylindrales bacterium]
MNLTALRDDILARHYLNKSSAKGHCNSLRCNGQVWPCDAARLASLLTVERVAAGLRQPGVMSHHFESSIPGEGGGTALHGTDAIAPALLDAIAEAEK